MDILYIGWLDDKIMNMKKIRLDELIVERCLVETMSKANGVIMAGQVLVDGEIVDKKGTMVLVDSKVYIDKGMRYVSRGGLKLEKALSTWNISLDNVVCADVGISTGGFTDCMLQNGAKRVYGVDVGKGIVHWKLRQDKRVILLENTNARYLDALPEVPTLVTVDVAFISLRLLLAKIQGWLNDRGGYILALIKPQFEARRNEVGKGGVVRSTKIHREVLERILEHSIKIGLRPLGLVKSPILGAAGNLEFFLYLSNNRDEIGVNPEKLIEMAMEDKDG
jgi:23S rRNA (cytidine1920-2'-O)/16S rRNA (cytidine1409-2'-O)-methyltransferase